MGLPFAQYNMDEAFADSFASYAIDQEVKSRYPQWAALVEAVQESPERNPSGKWSRADTIRENKRVDAVMAAAIIRASEARRMPMTAGKLALDGDWSSFWWSEFEGPDADRERDDVTVTQALASVKRLVRADGIYALDDDQPVRKRLYGVDAMYVLREIAKGDKKRNP